MSHTSAVALHQALTQPQHTQARSSKQTESRKHAPRSQQANTYKLVTLHNFRPIHNFRPSQQFFPTIHQETSHSQANRHVPFHPPDSIFHPATRHHPSHPLPSTNSIPASRSDMELLRLLLVLPFIHRQRQAGRAKRTVNTLFLAGEPPALSESDMSAQGFPRPEIGRGELLRARHRQDTERVWVTTDSNMQGQTG